MGEYQKVQNTAWTTVAMKTVSINKFENRYHGNKVRKTVVIVTVTMDICLNNGCYENNVHYENSFISITFE